MSLKRLTQAALSRSSASRMLDPAAISGLFVGLVLGVPVAIYALFLGLSSIPFFQRQYELTSFIAYSLLFFKKLTAMHVPGSYMPTISTACGGQALEREPTSPNDTASQVSLLPTFS